MWLKLHPETEGFYLRFDGQRLLGSIRQLLLQLGLPASVKRTSQALKTRSETQCNLSSQQVNIMGHLDSMSTPHTCENHPGVR